MKALGRRWFLLFLVATAWAQDALVSVTCGHGWLSVAVPAGLLGSRVADGELTLGSGCGVTSADGDRYRLEHPLLSCGTTLEFLQDSIRYSNVLRYRPSAGGAVARASPFSLPVDCYYPRTGDVSLGGAIQPTWVPFGSTLAHRRRLRFALDAYDSSWSSRLPQPSYSLGELINIQASVDADPRLPLRVFVDQCVASPSAVATRLRYAVIADNGCLLGGELGRSRFLPQCGDGSLRFQLDTFLFPNTSDSQIYLRCHLKAVAEGAAGATGKACSYDRVAATWLSPDGDDCSCCGSLAGCGGQRRRRQLAGTGGLLGEASIHFGPLRLVSSVPTLSSVPTGLPTLSSVPALSSVPTGLPTLSSVPALSSVPTELPTAPEPTTASPHRPSIPVVQGEKRDSGLAVPATTLAMVAMCSILAAVGMAGCYCSVRRHRRGERVGGPEAAPGEPRDVAMAPTAAPRAPRATPKTPPAPGDPATV